MLTCKIAHKRLLSPFQTTFECIIHETTDSTKKKRLNSNGNLKTNLPTKVSLH